jgi:hypothetical protein
MSEPEKHAERGKNAELIRLTFDIPGIAEAGDAIIHDPNHPNPALRLCRVRAMNIEDLPYVKEQVVAHDATISGLIKSSGGRTPEA